MIVHKQTSRKISFYQWLSKDVDVTQIITEKNVDFRIQNRDFILYLK